jgi:beta-glucanase (GH16 family)
VDRSAAGRRARLGVKRPSGRRVARACLSVVLASGCDQTRATESDPASAATGGSPTGGSAVGSSVGGGPGSSPTEQDRGDAGGSGWALTFSDEFDTAVDTATGSGIDPAKWAHEVNCWGGGNNEQQCYTARPENAFIDAGSLHIVAREETYSGPAINDDDPGYDPADVSGTLPFTSARLRSKGLYDFRYGRVEVRAQLVGGQGMWPAFWMLPSAGVYGAWPASGEIDLMEAVNLDVQGAPNEVYGTLHYGLPWPQWSPHGANHPVTDDLTQSFHIYALEWEADEIRWYIDGVHYQTQRSEGWYNYIWKGQEAGFQVASPRAPFDEEFHLLLNLAVGGNLPGPPDSGWAAPREMFIDYVRVYQCTSGNEDGTGCAGQADAVDPSVEANLDLGAPRVQGYTVLADGAATLPSADGGSASLGFVPGFYAAAEGNVSASFVESSGEHGSVWAVTFSGPGDVFLTSARAGDTPTPAPIALDGGAGWANVGELSFDLFVESRAPDTGFFAKLDSGYPNLGQVALEELPLGEWVHVAVPVAELLSSPEPSGSGLDLASVVNVFVLEATGSAQARIQIDNVRLSCAVNGNPLSWQTDTRCGIGMPTTTTVLPTDVSAP